MVGEAGRAIVGASRKKLVDSHGQRETRCRSRRLSVPRPALHVEDHASAARGADEPFAPPRIAQTEGAATDRARGHLAPVARAHRLFACRHQLADLLLLPGLELRLLAGHPAPVARTSAARNASGMGTDLLDAKSYITCVVSPSAIRRSSRRSSTRYRHTHALLRISPVTTSTASGSPSIAGLR